MSPSRVALAILCTPRWACTTTPVEIHDRGVTQLEVRGTGRFEDPAPGETWFGLRLEGARASDSTHQGLSATDDVALGGQRAHGDDRWVGALTGAEFTWTPTTWIGLEGRAALTTRLRAQSGEFELAVAIAPRSALYGRIGWRWLDADSSLEGESDLDLALGGPLIALRGTF